MQSLGDRAARAWEGGCGLITDEDLRDLVNDATQEQRYRVAALALRALDRLDFWSTLPDRDAIHVAFAMTPSSARVECERIVREARGMRA